MDDKSRLIAEYLDGELPQDIRARFETALVQDASLRAAYEKARAIKSALAGDAQSFRNNLDNREALAKDRVWEKIGSRQVPATKPSLWSRRIALPMPLLAALAFAIIGSAGLSLALQGGGNDFQPALATMESPSTFSMSPSEVALPGSPSSFSMPLGSKSGGVEITIKVEDLDQLLRLLEGNRSDRDISVQMPGSNLSEALGEPELIKASEQNQ